MTRRVNAVVDTALQRDLLLLEEAKAEVAAWTAEVDRIQSRMCERVVRGEPIVVDDGDEEVRGTPIFGGTVVLDEGKLKRRVGAEKFNKVTVQVLDKKKLEAAMLTGLIPTEWVAECSEEKPSKPYIRITRKRKIGKPNRKR